MKPADGPVILADGTSAGLLHDRIGAGIGAQFAALVDEPVTRLLIISPYWDMRLNALNHLAQTLSPSAIAVLVDRAPRRFPGMPHDSAWCRNLQTAGLQRSVPAREGDHRADQGHGSRPDRERELHGSSAWNEGITRTEPELVSTGDCPLPLSSRRWA